jgi:predicted metalloprotease with PDZ domain
MDNDLTLDGYMQLIWQKYGNPTQAYELSDLRTTLAQYAGAFFADFFFESFIYNAQQPNYQKGFENVGISYEIQNSTTPFFGAMVSNIGGTFTLVSNPLEGTSSYQAGLSYGDVILEIGGKKMGSETSFNAFIRSHYLPGQVTNLIIERHGKTKSVPLEFKPYPQIILKLLSHAPAESQVLRQKWLDSKTSK